MTVILRSLKITLIELTAGFASVNFGGKILNALSPAGIKLPTVKLANNGVNRGNALAGRLPAANVTPNPLMLPELAETNVGAA